ncbi:M4 family metallopeptidase [Streptomyces violaceusniger]|uniref:Neutral metalloproteinase n=1 Tax=Streptomyces violaceusniger (strain Tu 4113) TaxID=653045 RepID=G2NY24_STRV4|nr:M4 family metallopeptidase [Streptomyces violaceusniger]AEM81513.1 peptidase M4 thermolysin [Streptomyces violaceusniger Tu 4113]
MDSRSTSAISGISRLRRSRTALAAGAATLAASLLAAGATAGSANAAAPSASSASSTPATSSASRADASTVSLSPSVRAELLREAGATAVSAAKSLGLGAKEKLVVKDVIKDADGTTHTRYERTYAGLPVLGGDLIAHQSASGASQGVDKATGADIKVADTSAAVAPSGAERSALSAAQAAGDKETGAKAAPRKVIWAATGKPTLAYETVVTGVQKDRTPSKLHVITDADTGKKLYEFQAVENGTGTGQHNGKVTVGSVRSGSQWLLKDAARGGHMTYNLKHAWEETKKGSAFYDADNVWGNGKPTIAQTAAVDVHYGAAMTWDYYKKVLGRNGIKGNGKAAYSRVHYGDAYENAFWDDDCFCMTYGDGAGNKKPLTALDVAGHEMSHGLTSATANLEYSGESGGLNEATSDIFGTAVEFYAKNAKDPGDYLIGEKIDINGDGTPLRYMDKPSKDGLSYDYWKSGVGNDDPHFTSGIANHFFYLLAEGSGRKVIGGVTYDSPTKDGRTVKGIGRAKAEKIWYKALSSYMTSTTNYAKARTATLKAAKALYGASSAEYKAVDNAWGGVNVK